MWEWSFSIPQGNEVKDASLNMALTNDDFWVFDSTWSDFKPFYRGRPVDPDQAASSIPRIHTSGASWLEATSRPNPVPSPSNCTA